MAGTLDVLPNVPFKNRIQCGTHVICAALVSVKIAFDAAELPTVWRHLSDLRATIDPSGSKWVETVALMAGPPDESVAHPGGNSTRNCVGFLGV